MLKQQVVKGRAGRSDVLYWFVSVLLAGCALVAPTATAYDWTIATPDTAGIVGQQPSLAVDPVTHVVHIAYYDSTLSRLRYARYASGSWTTETVDDGNVGWRPSLALDSSGEPHIAYHAAGIPGHRGVMYASRSGGQWTVDSVTTYLYGDYVQLKLDAYDTPCIVYSHDGVLLYSKRANSVWPRDTIATWTGNWAMQASLALTTNGDPCVLYSSGYSSHRGYAKKTNGVWSRDTLGVSGLRGVLALDPSNVPYITEGDAWAMYCAHEAGGTWVRELVDTAYTMAAWTGMGTSMVVGGDGRPQIAFAGWNGLSRGFAKYARRTASGWTVGFVDTTAGTTDYYNSLALDASGNPHVAFYSNYGSDLKYATADVVPPDAAQDLALVTGRSTAVVRWTAPGDDGTTGSATEYDLRYSTSAITSASFDTTARVSTSEPYQAGTLECAGVSGLSGCRTYYFALKTKDDAGNWSGLSNVPSAATQCGSPPWEQVVCMGGEEMGAKPTPGEMEIPAVMALGAPRPNPARDLIRVEYGVPASDDGAEVDLAVFDVLGRRVQTLARGIARPGRFTASWDPRNRAAGATEHGIYFIRLRVGNEQRVRPVSVLR